MKKFFLGIAQIIIASVLINWIYDAWQAPKIIVQVPDITYPSPRVIENPTVIATIVESQTTYKYESFIIGSYDKGYGTTLFFNLEDLKEYSNPDRSYLFRSNMEKDRSKTVYLSKGTRVEVIQYAYPFIKVRLWYQTSGWIKA